MAKIRVKNYTFDKTAKTVTFTDFASIELAGILLVVNVTDNIIIYNFADPTIGGTVLTNVLTLEYDTSSMDNSDKLLILYDDAAMSNDALAYGEVFASPQDFTATYTSSTSITISGSPFTIDDTACYVAMISYKPTAGRWQKLMNARDGVSMVASSNVITVTGAGTPFAAGDTYRVVVFAQKKSYDSSTDTDKVSIQNPCYSRTTDPEPIIAAAQTLTTSYADVGYEIATSGYKTLGIYYKQTINSAGGCRIQVLAKHTSAGSFEGNLAIEGVSSGLITLSSEEIQFPDSSGMWLVKVQLDNVVPYVQIQAKETTDGGADATIDELNVVKGY